MATLIKFTQDDEDVDPPAGEAAVGASGSEVVVSNSEGRVVTYRVSDVPDDEVSLTEGELATATTASFTPNATGTYQVEIYDADDVLLDRRDFIIPTIVGDRIPATSSDQVSFNPSGSVKGWSKDLASFMKKAFGMAMIQGTEIAHNDAPANIFVPFTDWYTGGSYKVGVSVQGRLVAQKAGFYEVRFHLSLLHGILTGTEYKLQFIKNGTDLFGPEFTYTSDVDHRQQVSGSIFVRLAENDTIGVVWVEAGEPGESVITNGMITMRQL